MKRVTVSLKESHIERLDELQDQQDIDSRSEALRRLFQQHKELRREYRFKIESLEAECDELIQALETDL